MTWHRFQMKFWQAWHTLILIVMFIFIPVWLLSYIIPIFSEILHGIFGILSLFIHTALQAVTFVVVVFFALVGLSSGKK